MNEEKVVAELRRPAAKRAVGHDRDPQGFFVLVNALSEATVEKHAELLLTCELPAKIDCLTCRFHSRQWAGEPCLACLDRYTASEPYPKWRRA